MIGKMRFLLVIWAIYSNVPSSGSKDVFSSLRANLKTELSSSVYRRSIKGIGLVKINADIQWRIELPEGGNHGRILSIYGTSYIFVGNELLKAEVVDSIETKIKKVASLPIFEEKVVFVETFQFEKGLFLLACFKAGHCNLLRATPELNFTVVHSIATPRPAVDAKFFREGSDIYLLLINDPCRLYRWLGTYFDEIDHRDAIGARAATVFQSAISTFVVLSDNTNTRVFRITQRRFELMQVLPVKGAVDVADYSVTTEAGVIHFVFILMEKDASLVFMYNGEEDLMHWKSVSEIFGQNKIYFRNVDKEVFLFLTEKSHLKVYRSTTGSYELLQDVNLTEDILSIELDHTNNSTSSISVLTKNTDGLSNQLLDLEVLFIPGTGAKISSQTDQIIQCFNELDETLKKRDEGLNTLTELSQRVLFSNRPAEIKGTIKAKKVFLPKSNIQNTKAKHIQMNRTPEELRDNLLMIQENIKELENKLEIVKEGNQKSNVLVVKGDLLVDTLRAESLNIERMNGRVLQFERLLSLTKNQKLPPIFLPTLFTNNLHVGSINNMDPEDLLVQNADRQVIKGKMGLRNLKTNTIILNDSAKINNINWSEVVTNSTRDNIEGRKSFDGAKIFESNISQVNNDDFGSWMKKIIETSQNSKDSGKVRYNSLGVRNLNVSTVNNIPWNQFVNELYLIDGEEPINGNLIAKSNLRMKHLYTSAVNNISTDDFMTRTTKQEIRSNIKIHQLKTRHLDTPLLNNVHTSSIVSMVGENPVISDAVIRQMEVTGSFKIPNDEDEHIQYKHGDIILDSDINVDELEFDPAKLSIGEKRLNFEQLKDVYWLKNETQFIAGVKTFKKGIQMTEGVHIKNINNNDVDNVIKTSDTTIPTAIEFSTIDVINNVVLGPSAKPNHINVRRLNQTSVKKNGEFIVTGEKRFINKVEVKSLKSQNINGDSPDDILLRRDHLNFADTLQLNKIIIYGSLTSNEANIKHFNKFHLEKLNSALRLNDPKVFDHCKFLQLNVTDLSTYTLNDLYRDKLKEMLNPSANSNISLKLDGDLEVDQLNVGFINDHNLNDLLNKITQKNQSKSIEGHKVFQSMVTVNNFRGIINGKDLKELVNTGLSRNRPQNITGLYKVSFLNTPDIKADYLDDVSLDQIVYMNDNQTIRSNVNFNNIQLRALETLRFMDNCDLEKLLNQDWSNVAKINNLKVLGDLQWQKDHIEYKNLSYIYINAVTKSRDAVIKAPVEFKNDISAKSVNSSQQINDVDLDFILNDAVFATEEDQSINRDLKFEGKVKIKNLNVYNNVEVNVLNGVDVRDFNVKLVRRNEENVVTGAKTFANGADIKSLNTVNINDSPTSAIVYWNEYISENLQIKSLPTTTFDDLHILNELNVQRVNDVDMPELLSNRVSRSKPQRVMGHLTFKNDVAFKNLDVSQINDVTMTDVVSIRKQARPDILLSNVTFHSPLVIKHNLLVDQVNGYDLTDTYNRRLFADQDAVINGNVNFLSGFVSHGEINVLKHINGLQLNRMAEEVHDYDPSTFTASPFQRLVKDNIETSVEAVFNRSPLKVLRYFSKNSSFNLGLIQSTDCHVINFEDRTEIRFYGVDYTNCGLPGQCFCPSQRTLEVTSQGTNNIRLLKLEDNSRSYTMYYKDFNLTVEVVTTTVSFNERCMVEPKDLANEMVFIRWWKDSLSNETSQAQVNGGTLSDVEFTRFEDSIYIALGFFFKPSSLTNRVETIIYELIVHESSIKIIQKIPGEGIKRLHSFWTHHGSYLVIAKSLAVGKKSTYSEIYRFNESTNKFELLNMIQSQGTKAVESVRNDETSFIGYIDERRGSVTIYQFSHEYDIYKFLQEIQFRSKAISLTSIYLDENKNGDIFFGIATEDNDIHIYQYKYIEGFVKVFQTNVPDIDLIKQVFIDSKPHLLIATSSNSSYLLNINMQG